MTDPVRRRRQRVAEAASWARRAGGVCYLVAIAIFAVAVATELESAHATGIVALLVVGSLLLAPAIVLGYAVRAAEREDRESGR